MLNGHKISFFLKNMYLPALLVGGAMLVSQFAHAENVYSDLDASLGNLEKTQKMMGDRLNIYNKALSDLESKIAVSPPKGLPFPPTHPDAVHVNISDMTVQLASESTKKEETATSVIDLSKPTLTVAVDVNAETMKTGAVQKEETKLIKVSDTDTIKKYNWLYLVAPVLALILGAIITMAMKSERPKKLIKIKESVANKRGSGDIYEAFVKKFETNIQKSIEMKHKGVPESFQESLSKSAFGRWVLGIESAQDRHEIAIAFAQSAYTGLAIKYKNSQSLQLLFSAALVVLTNDMKPLVKTIAI